MCWRHSMIPCQVKSRSFLLSSHERVADRQEAVTSSRRYWYSFRSFRTFCSGSNQNRASHLRCWTTVTSCCSGWCRRMNHSLTLPVTRVAMGSRSTDHCCRSSLNPDLMPTPTDLWRAVGRADCTACTSDRACCLQKSTPQLLAKPDKHKGKRDVNERPKLRDNSLEWGLSRIIQDQC